MDISPPDNSPPPPDRRPLWRGLQNIPGWVSGLALALVVLCIILRTAIGTRDGASKDESEAIEKNFEAVRTTKAAYAMSRAPSAPAGTDRARRTSTQFADDAVLQWQKITRSSFAHASDWRRYALTLSLFERPGVEEAFRHIAEARAIDKARLDKEKSLSARSRRAQAAEVPVAEEVALWKALYSSAPIPADHVATLRMVIGRLHLGWFEHVAQAQLDTRIGQKPQAALEREEAYRSAALYIGFESLQFGLLMLGCIGLLIFGFISLLNFFIKTPEPSYARPASSFSSPVASPPAVPPLPGTGSYFFSYKARTIAFSVYMAVFMVIGLPLRLLRPLVVEWSAAEISRLNTVFELLAYVPVVWITLLALRHLAASESPTRTLPTWRETFRTLGMRSEQPGSDILAGALNYIMVMPLFFAVTYLSHKIFQHYHTPINPVQFESMQAQNSLDRLLLLLVTAVGAPIVEELMFRGLLYPALKPAWGGKVGAALVSGAIFAIVHPTIPSGFLPIMLLGVTFALTYERRGSLLANIVMHAIHNALILLTVFFLFAR